MVAVVSKSRRVKGRMAVCTAKLKAIKKGESFLLDDDSSAERSAWYQAAYRLNMSIAIRSTEQGGKGWRLT